MCFLMMGCLSIVYLILIHVVLHCVVCGCMLSRPLRQNDPNQLLTGMDFPRDVWQAGVKMHVDRAGVYNIQTKSSASSV